MFDAESAGAGGRGGQSSLFETCPEIQSSSKFHLQTVQIQQKIQIQFRL